jgi:hypothetical protein
LNSEDIKNPGNGSRLASGGVRDVAIATKRIERQGEETGVVAGDEEAEIGSGLDGH